MPWLVKPSAMSCRTSRSRRGERLDAGALIAALGLVEDFGEVESFAEGAGEVAVAAMDGLDGEHELGDVGLLDDVAGGAGRMDSRSWSSSTKPLSMTTRVPGEERRIWRVASRPLRPGMTTSIRTTSGFSASTAWTASRSVFDIGDDFELGLVLEQHAEGLADTAWSSTSRMRMGCWPRISWLAVRGERAARSSCWVHADSYPSLSLRGYHSAIA